MGDIGVGFITLLCATVQTQRGEPMNDYGTEKKQCFDDYENGSLIMSDEKCKDCEHRYECRFMQKAMDEVVYGSD